MEVKRLFVACPAGAALHARIAELQAQLGASDRAGAFRWVPPENVHLTLKFLGAIGAPRVEEVSEVLAAGLGAYRDCGGGVIDAAVAGAGFFGPRRRPRLVWVGLAEATGALAELHRQVETALGELGFAVEKRPFRPHLTIGRVRGRGVAGEDLGAAVRARSVVDLGRMRLEEVVLHESELRLEGARYSRLASFPLAAPP